ncbi:MAG: NBR1-Ig-like domain-containing protein [bacterium]|nr:NBR1-Ig-like domain-containing protein [bacterium]MDZ4296247.1 NBR1-Ig-like domain-containing protein [Patescibacteria group bacterium]
MDEHTNQPGSEKRAGVSAAHAAETTLQALQSKYVLVGKGHVKAWQAWLIIGLAAGIAMGVILVANRTGRLDEGYAASSPGAITPIEVAFGGEVIGIQPQANAMIGKISTVTKAHAGVVWFRTGAIVPLFIPDGARVIKEGKPATLEELTLGDIFTRAVGVYDSGTRRIVLASLEIIGSAPNQPTGDILLEATLDDQPWSGNLSYNYCISGYGCIDQTRTDTVPTQYIRLPAAGTKYTLTYAGGGPGRFVGIASANASSGGFELGGERVLRNGDQAVFRFLFVSADSAFNRASCDNIRTTLVGPVNPGQVFNATVAMKNEGTNAWFANSPYPYQLAYISDTAVWGRTRVALPLKEVAPGASATFDFTVTAPRTEGTYPFEWQMIQEGAEHFGAVCGQEIGVSTTADFKTLSGKVVSDSIDAQAGTFRLTQGTAGSVLVETTASTVFLLSSKPASFDAIREDVTLVIAQGVASADRTKVTASTVNVTAPVPSPTPSPSTQPPLSVSITGTVLSTSAVPPSQAPTDVVGVIRAKMSVVTVQGGKGGTLGGILAPGKEVDVLLAESAKLVLAKTSVAVPFASIQSGDVMTVQAALYDATTKTVTAHGTVVITVPAPVLSAITPVPNHSPLVARQRYDLVFKGTGFRPGAAVISEGITVPAPVSVSPTEIRINGLSFAKGTYSFQVRNQNPDGSQGVTSGSLSLSVQ